ncbi:MAG: DUF5719 family protein [Actinomycetota bacterium]
MALLVGVAVVAGGIAAGNLGPAEPGTASGSARSGIWICPHGGGKEWTGTVTLANPGAAPVDARVSVLGEDRQEVLEEVSVPAGSEILVEVPARESGSSTYVEYFGGWIAAGWIVRAPEPVAGIGTEPCLPSSAATWFATGASSERGTRSWLIVTNPHAEESVFDIALFSSSPPLRDRDLTGIALPGRRSAAFRLDTRVLGEPAVGVEVDAIVGRVGVSIVSVTGGGGVRSITGVAEPSASWLFPTAAGAGQSSLLTLQPSDDEVLLFTTSLLTDDPAEVSAGSLEVPQGGGSALVTPVGATGPSSLQVSALEGGPFVAALRSEGRTADDAATGGAVVPATTWVVPPTVANVPAHPGLVVVNDGATDVTVELTLLPSDDADGATVSATVPAGSVFAAPSEFLLQSPRASVLVAADGPVVALSASTSGGKDGLSLYGLAMGVPVPAWALVA